MAQSQLTIATRESPLALWQANWVKIQLEKYHPELEIKLLGMTTQADRLSFISLAEMGGKGLFVKELEEALLDGRADIAVHSLKDMPVILPSGLYLSAVCEREDAHDAFVSNQFNALDELPAGAIVGTSSLRRQSQLLFLRPDLIVKKLRGNVNTRLAKLDKKEFDAIILASAGLKRLNYENRIREFLSYDQFLPAMGQGALGIECRENDAVTRALMAPLNHVATQICVSAERAMCQRLEVGCQVPVAAFAEIKNEKLILNGLVASVDGSVILQAVHEDSLGNAKALGFKVAEDLLSQGAGAILKSL
ncbi:MAG: hydroxymethylbilane synthase [Gammaproteobacteria bacterium]|nr:hydroxymethylbilane synthase [Gammaproteobacteria bacterium]